MNAIDLTPLYRSSIGFDGLASLLDRTLNSETVSPNYPPYNIEIVEDNRYDLTLSVAGFDESELNIQVEKGVLTVSGKKAKENPRKYLYQAIDNRSFERKFNLADYIEVSDAELRNGLLTISLVKEIPEAMKPKSIAINQSANVVTHNADVADKNTAVA